MVEPKSNQSKQIISWDQYWEGIKDLKRQLDTLDWIDDNTTFYGIPRGGAILSTLLVYHLNRRAGTISSVAWNDLMAVHEVQQSLYKTNRAVHLETLVLVDDIIDSGQTISAWIKLFRDYTIEEENFQIKTVALFKRHSCPIQPDIFHREVKDNSWLIFPYEEE